jgi:hypothetical protein
MRYTLQITGKNTTREPGETLLIEFNSALVASASITSIDVSYSPHPLPVNSWHNLDLRWSHDKMSWSAWEPYTVNGVTDDATLAKATASGKAIYVQLKATRAGVSFAEVELTSVSINYTASAPPETPLESPFNDSNCVASSCSTTNFCNGCTISCDPSEMFMPYAHLGPAVAMYQNMNCVAAEIYGHCGRYFRVEPLQDSGDAVLKEYSIFDATDVKDIKFMVPNNEFPDNKFNYTELDMDFMQDGLEIQVIPQHFERAFGKGKMPQEKDFIYIPLLDRLFEVNSSYLFRGFMASPAYYKVMLFKADNNANVLKDRARPEIGEAFDEMTTDFEEVLREDLDKETERIIKPLQYRAISIGGNDHVRSAINVDLHIEEQDIYNYFTLLSRYHYDMASVPHDELGVRYKAKIPSSTRSALTFWIQPKKSALTEPLDNVVTNATGASGMTLSFTYGSTGPTSSPIIAPISSTLTIGSTSFTFPNLTMLPNEWYGCVLNMMPEFGQVELSLWAMRPKTEKSNELRLVYDLTLDCPADLDVSSTEPISLPGSDCNITSIRLWKSSIEEEKQPILLNQHLITDSHMTIMADDCVPPLRLPKQYTR